MSIADAGQPTAKRSVLAPELLVLAAYLALVLVVPGAIWVGLVLLIITALVLLKAQEVERSTPTRAIGVAMCAVFAAALFSYLLHPLTPGGFMTVWHFGLLPVVFGVAYILGRGDVLPTLWLGSTVGAGLAGVLALGQVALGENRPSGFVASPISFGAVALLLAFMSLATHEFSDRSAKLTSRATWMALILGGLASFLSASRSGWIAIPALLIVVGYQFRHRLTARNIRVGVATGTTLVVGAAILTRGFLLVRAEAIFTDISGYIGAAPTETARGTSIGSRIEMWRVSLDAAGNDPWFGIGWGHLAEVFDHRVEKGLSHWRLGEYIHAHNQYVSSLASGGLVGLATVVAALAIPGWYFTRALRNSDAATRALGSVGLIFVGSYALLALTESVFEDVLLLVPYALTVGLVTAQLAGRPVRSGRRDPLSRRV